MMKRFIFNKYFKYTSSLSEWSSSLYLYNKKNLFLSNYNDKKVYDLFYNYFNLNLSFKGNKEILKVTTLDFLKKSLSIKFYLLKNIMYFFNIKKEGYTYFSDNNNIEKNKTKNLINKLFRLSRLYKYRMKKNYFLKSFKNRSVNKIFISNPEIRHSLNEVSITLYVYNREKFYFLKKLSVINKNFFNILKKNRMRKSLLLNKLRKIDYSFKYIKNGIVPKLFNSNLLHYKNNLYNFKNFDNYFNIIKFNNISTLFTFNNNKYLLNNIKKLFYINSKKIFLYKYYISIIYLNNFKFNYINLIELKKKLYKIFNKKININIINLKYLYMENSMFVEGIINKLNDRKKKVLRVIRKALSLGKVVKLHPLFFKLRKKGENNLNTKLNLIRNFLFTLRKSRYMNIISNLKNKHVSGLRIEAKGRLTKRLTASRAVYKLSYKGSLKNIYSSYNKLSTTMLRGLHKSNINYVNNNSKNRNGSYGIKYWLSSY